MVADKGLKMCKLFTKTFYFHQLAIVIDSAQKRLLFMQISNLFIYKFVILALMYYMYYIYVFTFVT